MTRPWIWWSRREGWVLVAACAAAATVAMLLGGTPWLGSWKMALDWADGTLIVVGPICAGLVARHYSRYARLGIDGLVPQLPRGTAAWLTPALAAWGIGAGVVVAVAAVSTSLTLSSSRAVPGQLVILVLGASVLAAQVMVGALLGTRAPGPWAPPVAAVLVFGLGVLSSSGVIPETFRTGGVTGPLVGEVYDVPTVLWQSTVALATFLVLLVLTVARVSVRLPRSLVALATTAALAGGLAWVDGSVAEERYRFAPTELGCAGSAPQVCMAVDTTRPLDSLARAMHEAAAPLVEAGGVLPRRWVQAVPGRRVEPGDGTLVLLDDAATAKEADPRSVVASLASPTACPQLSSNAVPVKALDVRQVLVEWLRAGGGAGRSGYDRLDRWLATDEAAAWAVATYADLRACRLDDLDTSPLELLP